MSAQFIARAAIARSGDPTHVHAVEIQHGGAATRAFHGGSTGIEARTVGVPARRDRAGAHALGLARRAG